MKAIEELSVKFETKQIEAQNKNLQNEIALQKIKTEKKNYFIYGTILLLLLIAIIFILYVRQNKYKTQKESLDIEQKLLQIQMNPHFIFNSLQAIQSFILTNKTQQTASYLTSFSRLMRLILENSKHEFITLDKEINTLTYYLELQKLRFKNVFNYTITIDESIDKDFIYLPPMLLQPFIENAIEHGFKNLERPGELNFSVSAPQKMLTIEITDNGHGITKSKQMKEQSNHHSYALEIINKRIELLNQKQKTNITLNVIDLLNTNALLQGTKIVLTIPTINKLK
jgi:LytS/YehU family sensor histidine kinase